MYGARGADVGGTSLPEPRIQALPGGSAGASRPDGICSPSSDFWVYPGVSYRVWCSHSHPPRPDLCIDCKTLSNKKDEVKDLLKSAPPSPQRRQEESHFKLCKSEAQERGAGIGPPGGTAGSRKSARNALDHFIFPVPCDRNEIAWDTVN
ncbi:unnamed protein product [Pleuronectes platessa]|uniref:Uncharacterized protein n=1 Tax=Pleuronectes platessa TaxID=8262 RepID=A0A9N7YID0_PLEPL|nr:unnamed protein product [Pleuronectes platessa]